MILANETMFYGGIIMIISSLILTLMYTIISMVSVTKLKKKLNMEYGEEIKLNDK